MRAMLLERAGAPLVAADLPVPEPGPGQVQLRVLACGVCRTDLHIVDGELPRPKLPLVPGHEIIAEVSALGAGARQFRVGERVGVPWLGWTCGACALCRSGRENLCAEARFTGYDIDGGYAEFVVADERYCFALPGAPSAQDAAPWLCAGLIGYRALSLAGEGVRRLGIYGFGAAAHLVAQVAVARGCEVHAFTRDGDRAAQDFACALGAAWAGPSSARPPAELDAALIFAPVGALVPAALAATARGGCVACGGIHMSAIPSFDYELLWGERMLRSVANLTRADAQAFLPLAARIPVRTHTVAYPLGRANEALADLRAGRFSGAAVLIP